MAGEWWSPFHKGEPLVSIDVELAKAAGLKVNDFAKRLQDYGFHPPTCSWPISTCMLIEPTESETLEEIDRCAKFPCSLPRDITHVYLQVL